MNVCVPVSQLHAPMSDLESVVVDADAVYIDLPDNRINFTDRQGANARDAIARNWRM
jgi:hypothetical protein